jgi:hypothetical protein
VHSWLYLSQQSLREDLSLTPDAVQEAHDDTSLCGRTPEKKDNLSIYDGKKESSMVHRLERTKTNLCNVKQLTFTLGLLLRLVVVVVVVWWWCTFSSCVRLPAPSSIKTNLVSRRSVRVYV